MARIGVTENEIAEAITALQVEGNAITVQAVRKKLGTGSYSTIQAALERWRKSQSDPINATPEAPELVNSLFRNVWAETWKESQRNFATEKAAFAEERARFEALRVDMGEEISRLETELSTVTAAHNSALEKAKQTEDATHELRLKLTKEEGRRGALEAEVSTLRTECESLRVETKAWIERASRAEGKLEASEAISSGKSPQRK